MVVKTNRAALSSLVFSQNSCPQRLLAASCLSALNSLTPTGRISVELYIANSYLTIYRRSADRFI